MTIRGQDFDEAIAYARTTRTLERLCREYGFEYVLGIFSNGMPEHERMRREEERQRALEKMQRRQARARQRRQQQQQQQLRKSPDADMASFVKP
jgi:hypothetical protein